MVSLRYVESRRDFQQRTFHNSWLPGGAWLTLVLTKKKEENSTKKGMGLEVNACMGERLLRRRTIVSRELRRIIKTIERAQRTSEFSDTLQQ